ncbi:MAG: tetratricopeptide repeat protein, partial [Acidobacteriota bacterium]|nr:tetratricopeptide repeat protein [Acidobacteriota bacterium]
IASKLFEEFGAEKLDSYSNTGAIGFFADYVALSRKSSFPKQLRVDETLASRIEALNMSWEKTNTPENRRIIIDPSTDLDEFSNRMRQAFAGEKVYPDHSATMLDAVRSFAARGKFEQAIKLGALAVDLYPQLDETNTIYGVLMILSGKNVDGMNALRRSISLDANGTAGPRGLLAVAGDLVEIRLYPQALMILKAAAELHPGSAMVLYRLGDFQQRSGDKKKALEYYKKALAIDPDLEVAKKALAELDMNQR